MLNYKPKQESVFRAAHDAAARIELNLCCERTDVSLDAAEADNGVELRKCVGHVRVRATQAIVEVRRLLCQINRVLSWT